MERNVYRICLGPASAALLLLCGGLHGAHAQDTDEQHVSAGFASVGFVRAIDALENSGTGIVFKYDASLWSAKTGTLDPKKVDFPATVTLAIQNQPMGKALQALLNKAYTPLTYRRAGNVYTIIPDASRKETPHPNRAGDVPLSGAQSFTFTNTPFDEAIDMMFRSYRLRYVIQPDVPVIREGVTIVIDNARADEALSALLSSVSTAKTALTHRYENGKYVISVAEGGGAAQSTLPPTIPNGGWDLEYSEMPLESALRALFRTMKVDYVFAGSLNGSQPVSVRRHFDSEEAAVVAILRSAQPDPMRLYRKHGTLVTLVNTDAAHPGGAPIPADITCHCTNADFAAVVKTIFGAFHKNYRIDTLLLHVPITLSLDHASFDEAYKSICKALPPNSAHLQDGMYDFGN